MNAVDLFAGPGGWDVGAIGLGLDPLGIEWDNAACRVRKAAGLRTLQADVAELDPLDFPCELLIASPPCTAFSMAGKGEGRKAIDTLLACVRRMGDGETINKAELDDACADSTAHLVLEPLRWALALNPAAIACEQVPPVLPLWEAMAAVLQARGYSTWTGVLSSEQYGVPQTRKRAILIASRETKVGPPAPTHARYVAPRNREDDGGGLFDLPEPERVVLPEDRHLLPWVSMAEALGWGMTARPYPAIASSRTTGGPDKEKVGGSGAREIIYNEQEAGRWQLSAGTHDHDVARDINEPAPTITAGHDSGERVWVETNNFEGKRNPDGSRSDNYRRPVDQPSPTIGSRADLWQIGWTPADGRPSGQRRHSGPQAECAPRSVDEPSFTIRSAGSGSAPSGVEWVNEDAQFVPTALDRRQTSGTGDPVPLVGVDRPAPTMTSTGMSTGRDVWVHERPATTVQGDPRISEPGWRGGLADYDADGNYHGTAQQANAVRVTEEQAACLQGFPPGYPWHAAGSRSKAFQCIGNAVPPPLAQAVLATLTNAAALEDLAA